MGSLKDTEEFQRGEQFERALSTHLQGRGWSVLPVYDYSPDDDKPPAFENASAALVLPDLFTARAGEVHWCEAKRKAKADWTHITSRLETGLSLRLLNHYRAVKAETGIDVWVFFGHELEDEVRFCEIDGVEWRPYTGLKMGPGGMAFVGWDDLRRLTSLSAVMEASLVAA